MSFRGRMSSRDSDSSKYRFYKKEYNFMLVQKPVTVKECRDNFTLDRGWILITYFVEDL